MGNQPGPLFPTVPRCVDSLWSLFKSYPVHTVCSQVYWQGSWGKDVCYLAAKLYPSLCGSVGCSPPGSSVHGISQARILVPFPSPKDLPDPGIEPMSPVSPALEVDFFFVKPLWHLGNLSGFTKHPIPFSFFCLYFHGPRSESRIPTGNQPPW